MRATVAEIGEKFARGEWQDALFDSQVMLEARAREYLIHGAKSGRIVVLDGKGAPNTPSKKVIDRAPMGQLKDWYENIKSPNSADDSMAKALVAINPHRIRNAHFKLEAKTRRRLKPLAAKLLWVSFDAIDKSYR